MHPLNAFRSLETAHKLRWCHCIHASIPPRSELQSGSRCLRDQTEICLWSEKSKQSRGNKTEGLQLLSLVGVKSKLKSFSWSFTCCQTFIPREGNQVPKSPLTSLPHPIPALSKTSCCPLLGGKTPSLASPGLPNPNGGTASVQVYHIGSQLSTTSSWCRMVSGQHQIPTKWAGWSSKHRPISSIWEDILLPSIIGELPCIHQSWNAGVAPCDFLWFACNCLWLRVIPGCCTCQFDPIWI